MWKRILTGVIMVFLMTGTVRADTIQDGHNVFKQDSYSITADHWKPIDQRVRSIGQSATTKLTKQEARLTEGISFSALGFDGTRPENIDQFTLHYQDSLQREAQKIFSYHMNIFEIESRMQSDHHFANAALSYVIQSGDFREAVVTSLENGNIQVAKVLLRQSGIEIDLTTSFGEFERAIVHGYLDSQIGLGVSNFRYVESNSFTSFLEEKGYNEITPANTQEFLTVNPDALTYGISSSALKYNIEIGSIPILTHALPEDQQYISTLSGEMQASILAAYLSNEGNFIAYDAALKQRDISDLSMRLERVENTAR